MRDTSVLIRDLQDFNARHFRVDQRPARLQCETLPCLSETCKTSIRDTSVLIRDMQDFNARHFRVDQRHARHDEKRS
nr:hypothetical protein BgiMline_018712 [Biomphalaria glabrata]